MYKNTEAIPLIFPAYETRPAKGKGCLFHTFRARKLRWLAGRITWLRTLFTCGRSWRWFWHARCYAGCAADSPTTGGTWPRSASDVITAMTSSEQVPGQREWWHHSLRFSMTWPINCFVSAAISCYQLVTIVYIVIVTIDRKQIFSSNYQKWYWHWQ